MLNKKITSKKNLVFIGGVIIFLILLAIYNYTLGSKQKGETPNEICIKKKCFDIEIADTPQKRQLGLMNRSYLPESSGMLFVFQEAGTYTFWMKNTLIPLDMIRIDSKYTIIDIQEALPCTQDPCTTYTPKGISSFVLELNQGTCEKQGIGIGDKVKIK